MEEERLILFAGHFGSGKTEIAVNYAVRSARSGRKTVLVDLDIVNPFFRSSEVRDSLEASGVRVISPNFAGTAVEVPSLPAEIYSVFTDSFEKVIFDVGGDETGARALGQFFPFFRKEQFRMFYIINTKRPLSANLEDILEMLRDVEQNSRLQVTDLVNNTNLSYDTQVHDILQGQKLIRQVSQAVGVLPSYGPEMRGGTANCCVILSDNKVGSPVVTRASAVIAMNRPSLDKFEDAVVPDGMLFLNSSLIDRKTTRKDMQVIMVPANEIAEELGNSRVANSVMLGAYLEKAGSSVSHASVMEALKKVLGPSKQSLIPLNGIALKRGAEQIK